MKKISNFGKNFVLYTISYIWYIGLYIVILPYLILLVGRNLDILFFDYILNLRAVFYYPNISLFLAIIFGLIGVGFILWSFYTLYFYSGFFPLTIFPSSTFNPKKLSTYGPYSLVRHPMTLGYLFLLVGFGFFEGSLMTVLWVVPILGIVLYEYIIHREERRLSIWFGKEFEDYKEKTPFLFPRIKSKKEKEE